MISSFSHCTCLLIRFITPVSRYSTPCSGLSGIRRSVLIILVKYSLRNFSTALMLVKKNLEGLAASKLLIVVEFCVSICFWISGIKLSADFIKASAKTKNIQNSFYQLNSVLFWNNLMNNNAEKQHIYTHSSIQFKWTQYQALRIIYKPPLKKFKNLLGLTTLKWFLNFFKTFWQSTVTLV